MFFVSVVIVFGSRVRSMSTSLVCRPRNDAYPSLFAYAGHRECAPGGGTSTRQRPNQSPNDRRQTPESRPKKKEKKKKPRFQRTRSRNTAVAAAEVSAAMWRGVHPLASVDRMEPPASISALMIAWRCRNRTGKSVKNTAPDSPDSRERGRLRARSVWAHERRRQTRPTGPRRSPS